MFNFNDGLDAAIADIAKIEGNEWAKDQKKMTGWTVGTLYEAWKLTIQQMGADTNDHLNELVHPSWFGLPGDEAIYGNAGYSRYFVRWSGEIVTSRYHMSEHRGVIAETVGIKFI